MGGSAVISWVAGEVRYRKKMYACKVVVIGAAPCRRVCEQQGMIRLNLVPKFSNPKPLTLNPEALKP